MPGMAPIPGLWCEGKWKTNDVKRRHFVVDGLVLKLFGRRGKTFKGQYNLLAVTVLRPAMAPPTILEPETQQSSPKGAPQSIPPTPPPGALEVHLCASRSDTRTYFVAPDHSHADFFLALGNAVPSHATSDDLWRMHLRSRPALSGPQHEYRMGRTLGTGTFGKVKLAQRVGDGQMFAIKCLNRSRIVLASQGGRLAKEIHLLKLLNHPNLIRLHEVLHTPSEILMVMEYVEGGDLLEVLNTQQRFNENEVRHIFGQICCGVCFCHSLGVAHRDLKPENILISRRAARGAQPQSRHSHECAYTIRVADFGLSTLMAAGEFLKTACGSPHYVAPEVLNFNGTARYDGRESDVWSLGVILYVLLCYKLPFEAESTALLYKKIRQGLPSPPGHVSPAARDLLCSMLEVNPEQRVSLKQVVQCEWLQLDVETPHLSRLVDAMAVQVDPALPAAESRADLSARDPTISASPVESSSAGVRRAFTFDTLPTFSEAPSSLQPSPLSSPRDLASREQSSREQPASDEHGVADRAALLEASMKRRASACSIVVPVAGAADKPIIAS